MIGERETFVPVCASMQAMVRALTLTEQFNVWEASAFGAAVLGSIGVTDVVALSEHAAAVMQRAAAATSERRDVIGRGDELAQSRHCRGCRKDDPDGAP